MEKNNLQHISTCQPTYWPSDMNKQPDLLDFCITKGLALQTVSIESCLELSSDHTPILVTLHTSFLRHPKKPTLSNKNTDWEIFRELIEKQINLQIPLKTKTDLEDAVYSLTTTIQQAACQATPPLRTQRPQHDNPVTVKHILREKRAARKTWQHSRAPRGKQTYNKLTKELKQLLHHIRNSSVQHYLTNLTSTVEINYSLWTATKKLKRPQQHIPPIRKSDGSWARTDKQQAETFAEHLAMVFHPFQLQLPNIQGAGKYEL